MPVPAGVECGWPSTNGSIPTGWSRVTGLDTRYPKGTAAGVDPDVTGGATTHSHSSPAHQHTIPSHQHTGTTGSGPSSGGTTTSIPSVATGGHTHTFTSGAQTANSSSDASSWGATAFDPTHYTVIWIESDGTPTGFPDGAVVYYNNGSAPSGWTQHSGSEERYFKGAAGAGDGGSTGGSLSAHTHSASGHTHTIANHTHSSIDSGASAVNNYAGGGVGVTSQHAHVVTFGATATGTVASATSASTASTAYEPPYHVLLAIENTSGGADNLIGAIVPWLGLLSAIPAGFLLCDGANSTPDLRGKYIKNAANGGGDVGGTGGTEGHDHTDPTGHTHGGFAHTHSVSTNTASNTVNVTGGVGGTTSAAHSHSGTTDSATGTTGSAVQTVDTNSSSNPPFRTVAWIQLQTALTVTISDPAGGGTVVAPGFLVDWDVTGGGTQVDYRVRIYESDQSTVVYDSGTQASATTEHTVPSTSGLVNSSTYYIRVEVTDDGAIAGDSGFHMISTDWTSPDTITGITVTPVGP